VSRPSVARRLLLLLCPSFAGINEEWSNKQKKKKRFDICGRKPALNASFDVVVSINMKKKKKKEGMMQTINNNGSSSINCWSLFLYLLTWHIPIFYFSSHSKISYFDLIYMHYSLESLRSLSSPIDNVYLTNLK
jgi:hypothetical protein